MVPFRDRSIRTKLPAIILVACFVALVLAGTAFSIHHQFTLRHSVQENLQGITNLLAVYLRQGMMEEDAQAIRRALAPMRQAGEVLEAGVLDVDGTPVHRVFRDLPARGQEPAVPNLRDSNVVSALVIDSNGSRLGTVYVLTDVRQVLRRVLLRNAAMVALFTLLAGLLAPAMTRPLQRFITDPLLDLTRATEAAAAERDYSVRVQKNSSDEVGGLVDRFNDLLAQLEAREEALRESAERYRTLVDNLPAGIGRIQTGGRPHLVQANPSLARHFGFASAAEMMRASVDEGHPHAAECAYILGEILAEAAESRPEVALTRTNGKRIWAAIQLHVQRDANGTLTGVDFVLEDVTKRKWAELELQRYREQLEKLVERRTGELTRANAQLQTEVADRVRAEHAVHENLNFLQTLIDAIPNPVFYKDTQGVYVSCNNAFAHMLALPKDAILGKTAFDMAPAANARAYSAADRELLADPHDQTYEATVRFGDGTEHPVIFYKGIFRDTQGKVAGIIGTVLDITERKQAEERIRKLNECFLSFGPAPMENIARLTRVCGELLRARYAFYTHTEQPAVDAAGASEPVMACRWRSDAALPPLHDAWNHVAEDMIEEAGSAAKVLYRHRDRTYWQSDSGRDSAGADTFAGMPVPCHGRVTGCLCLLFEDLRELTFEEHQMMGVIAAAIGVEEHRRHAEQERESFLQLIMEYSDGLEREVNERKRAEAQLKDYTVQLAHINDELKTFAYIVSHDLRAPLVNLKGFVGELRMALDDLGPAVLAGLPALDPARKDAAARALEVDAPESLRFVDAATTRMDRLLSAILDLSREGRRELRFTRVDTREVVEGVLRALGHQIEQRKVAVVVEDLPEITADYTALDQIFGNLLDNAVKYLDPGRPGRIRVYAREEEGAHWFYVEDNGRGLEPRDHELIFQVFRRAGREDVPGEGMGLAYVRTLVRRHGGDVACESRLNEGATFRFSIAKHLEPVALPAV